MREDHRFRIHHGGGTINLTLCVTLPAVNVRLGVGRILTTSGCGISELQGAIDSGRVRPDAGGVFL